MTESNLKRFIGKLNKEIGYEMVKISSISRKPQYTDAALTHHERSVLDAFVKLKNTKILQDYERKYKAVLKLDKGQLILGF